MGMIVAGHGGSGAEAYHGSDEMHPGQRSKSCSNTMTQKKARNSHRILSDADGIFYINTVSYNAYNGYLKFVCGWGMGRSLSLQNTVFLFDELCRCLSL